MIKKSTRLRKLLSGKRSKLEERIQVLLDKIEPTEYESDKLPFIQPSIKRNYIPDFKLKNGTYIEGKGRLTLEDRKKMLWVKEQNPGVIIRFIFGSGNNKLTKKSKTTYLDWAKYNGFEAIDVSEPIPKHWFKKTRKTLKEMK